MKAGWIRHAALGLGVAWLLTGFGNGRTALGETPGISEEVLGSTRASLSLGVHVGCRDGALMAALAVSGRFLVQGLAADEKALARTRADLQAKGLYGLASAELWDGKGLPYAEDLVNVIVCEAPAAGGPLLGEIMRVLCPGGTAFIAGAGAEELKPQLAAGGVKDFAAAGVKDMGTAAVGVLKFHKPRPAGMGEWTHAKVYDAGGSGVTPDTLKPVNGLRWAGGPHQPTPVDPRGSSWGMAAGGGRLVYVTANDAANTFRQPSDSDSTDRGRPEDLYVLVARDAHNGLPLWSRRLVAYKEGPAPKPFKSSHHAVHFGRTLIVSPSRVYGILYGRVRAIDATTGEQVRTYETDAGAFLPGQRTGNFSAIAGTLILCGDLLVAGGTGGVWAFDAESGTRRWAHKAPAANNLVHGEGKVFFSTPAGIVCLDEKTGQKVWENPQIKDEAPEVCKSGVLVTARYDKNSDLGGFHVLSPDDGKVLWTKPIKGRKGYGAVIFAGGLIWLDGLSQGHDPLTGKVVRTIQSTGSAVCRTTRGVAATENYLVDRKLGFTEIKAGKNVSAFPGRNQCGVGFVFANNLLYNMPHSCECDASGLTGFYAAAHQAQPDMAAAQPDRLRKGPAYGTAVSKHEVRGGEEWPTFRHDTRRSGGTPAEVPAALEKVWETAVDTQQGPPANLKGEWLLNSIGGDRLAGPTVAGGKVFVSLGEAHQVVALDEQTGKEVWRYTAGGRLDTAPTIAGGLCLFGCYDGWVYCLRAEDGQEVWRFRAAPASQRIVAYGQVESSWPVIGGVLVEQGRAYFSAGRYHGVDGGVMLYAVNPQTGQVLESKRGGKDAENTILVSTGSGVQCANGGGRVNFRLSGSRESSQAGGYLTTGYARKPSKFSVFNRNWRYPFFRRDGEMVGPVHPREGVDSVFWGSCGLLVSACPDRKKEAIFTLPWTPEAALKDGGDIFMVEEDPAATPAGIIADVMKRLSLTNPMWPNRLFSQAAKQKMAVKWNLKVSGANMVTCLVLTAKSLVVGGPTDRFDPEAGGAINLYDADSGKKLCEIRLASPPVADGLAVVRGRVYVAAQDGKVLCLGAR